MERVKLIVETIKQLEEEHQQKVNNLKWQLKEMSLTQEEFDFCYWSDVFSIEFIDVDRKRKPTPILTNYKCFDCKKTKQTYATTKSKLRELSAGLSKKNGRGSIRCPECENKPSKKIKTTKYKLAEESITDYSKMNYLEYLKTPKWKNIKNKIRSRAKNKCEKCGSNKELHTHHLTYERRGNELLSDLICLCKDCHEAAHGRKFEVR